MEKKEHLYKILVIGDLGTGKTSIIKRYVHNFFSVHYRATVSLDYKNINNLTAYCHSLLLIFVIYYFYFNIIYPFVTLEFEYDFEYQPCETWRSLLLFLYKLPYCGQISFHWRLILFLSCSYFQLLNIVVRLVLILHWKCWIGMRTH